MAGHTYRPVFNHIHGVTLVELLVALLMGAFLLTGLVQIAAGARSSFRLQEALAEVQESGRFAIDTLGGILRQSAFTPQPWDESTLAVGLTTATADSTSRDGDRLAVRTWSDRNCFGNQNPIADATGQPGFFLRETVLDLNDTGNLTLTCRYGRTDEEFVTQLRRQGVVQNVDAFQVLYAEDSDGDGMADRWIPAGRWLDAGRIRGLQLALLLSSRQAVGEPAARTYRLLDHTVTAPADGKLRRVFTSVLALRGRSK